MGVSNTKYSAIVLAGLAFACIHSSTASLAGSIVASVKDQNGKNLENAVLVAVPKSSATANQATPHQVSIDQIDKEFVPFVKVVQIGTEVYFPNKDDIRHHVYSFSQAKTFELPLYQGTPAQPVVFDKAGTVSIGCNIHDWMLGYIYVAESPYFGTTGPDGQVILKNIPVGDYFVRIWHPHMAESDQETGLATSVHDKDKALSWALQLKPAMRPPRAPVFGRRGY